MIRKEYRYNLILDLGFGLVLPALLIMLFLSPLILGKGFIFYGDEEWPIFTYHSTLGFLFYAWYNGSPTSSATLFFSLLESSLITIFGTYGANHIFVFLLPFLSGPASYFSILWTLKLYKYDNYTARIASLVGSVFYLLNWQNPTMMAPLYTWAMSYTISPILLFLVLKIFKQHRIRDILFFAMVSTLGDAIPLWILAIGLFIIVSLILKLFRHDWSRSVIKSLNDTLLLVAASFIANGYFIFEATAGFLYGAGGQYAVYSSTASSVSVAQSSSVFSLFDVFVFGQSKYYFFGLNPQNWTYLNLSVPLTLIFFIIVVILYSDLFKIRKESHFYDVRIKVDTIKNIRSSPIAGLLVSLVIVLVVSLFLSKGFNPPFGQIYYLVILLSPPGVQGITRDVGPFLMISALSYSFIFGLIAAYSMSKLREAKKLFRKVVSKEVSKKVISFSIVLILLLVALFATSQESSVTLQKTYSYFSPSNIPDSISNAVKFLDSLNSTGNVMWMPTGGTYPWKDNLTLTDFGANLVRNSTSPEYIYNYLFNTNGTSLGKVLDLSDTQYLVYDANASFAFNYPVTLNEKQILSLLENQSDLRSIYSSGGIFIYKNLALPSQLYAGTPNLGNPHASPYNISFQSMGSNLFVNSPNPYTNLYESNLIKPVEVTNGAKGLSGNKTKCVNIIEYKFQKTLYDYNSSIFSLKSYSLVNGEINATFNYMIPPYLQRYTGSGQFGRQFSVGMVIYPATAGIPEYPSSDSGKFETVDSSQYQINQTNGSVSFLFPDENGSIFLYYYLGSYSDASPYYYVGTLNSNVITVDPIPFYNSTFPLTAYSVTKNITVPSFLVISKPNVTVVNGFATNMSYYAFIVYPMVLIFNKTDTDNILSMYQIHIVPKVSIPLYDGNLHILENAPSTIRLKGNQSISVYLQTPVNGTYNVTLTGNSGFYLAGYGYFKDSKELNIEINGTYILKIKAASASNLSIEASLTRRADTGNLSSIREISPVQYSARIQWNGTVLIVLPQQYSPLWKLNYGGREYVPVPLYGGSATGFVLQSPHGEISIYYSMQMPLEFGYVTSSIFVIVSAVMIVIYRRH